MVALRHAMHGRAESSGLRQGNKQTGGERGRDKRTRGGGRAGGQLTDILTNTIILILSMADTATNQMDIAISQEIDGHLSIQPLNHILK